MVYFLQATDGGPIKIGHSQDVLARIKQLEATYKRPLALLATIPGGREEEQAIHARFSSLRFGKTEQFRPDPDLLAFIGRPLFVSACAVVEVMKDYGDQVVKIDAEVARLAKIVAAFEDKSLARYISDLLKPIVEAAYDQHIKKARPASDPKPPRR